MRAVESLANADEEKASSSALNEITFNVGVLLTNALLARGNGSE